MGFLELLRDKRWVNPRSAQAAAECKPNQLAAAESALFRIPRTLMTDDPERCREFAEKCDGRLVYKPFAFHMRERDGGIEALYTRLLHRDQVLLHSSRVRPAPCIFQEYVPKRVELRVTVIGQAVFVLEIDASRSRSARVDWRHYDLKYTRWGRGSLPAEVLACVMRLMRRMGLVFGCIDLIVTPAGGTCFSRSIRRGSGSGSRRLPAWL